VAALIIWMVAITISLVITILSAAAGMPVLHMGVTVAIALTIAIVGMQTRRALEKSGASRSALAATTSRTIALVWIWEAVALFMTYEFVLEWREANHFAIGFMLVGGLCFGLAIMFQKDADAGRDDDAMLKFARVLTILQTVGMLLAMVGLVIDGKFSFGFSFVKNAWAANNTFFFGALAVACLGANALIAEAKAKAKGAGVSSTKRT
jgi:hypothetical protein